MKCLNKIEKRSRRSGESWMDVEKTCHFSSTTFFSVWQKQQDSKPSANIPRSLVHRPKTLHVHCLHTSYWLAPFRLQNIVYLQLVTFQRIFFFGSFMNLPLLFLFLTPYLFTNLCVTYFPRAELSDSHATLTWDAQKSCAQTIGANVLKMAPYSINSMYT